MMTHAGLQGVHFVISLVLARILDPEHYGMLSLMMIFINLATVFVQSGFNTSLIQNKDVTEEDYSSVFWVSLGISFALYGVLYVCAPMIAAFYAMPEFVQPFRVLALILIPGALNSIQVAEINREMEFKKSFFCEIGATVISGTAGIAAAFAGLGVWALVIYYGVSTLITCVNMWFAVHWRPKWVCNFKRVGVLFSFGWKILVSALLNTGYSNLRSLVIGKKYDSSMLGYYNRGKSTPEQFIAGINSSVQAVLLPAMSAEQDNRQRVKNMVRNSISVTSYVVFPMMAGLAAVAAPFVRLLFTEKWIACVPFMQIYCFTLAFYPIHTSNLQAINAMGRSDIFLKLEILKKVIGILMLTVAVFCFDSPIAIAMTGVLTAFTSSFINAYPNKKLIGYSYFEQIRDILPSFCASLVMCAVVLLIGRLPLADAALLLVQVSAGVLIYVGISVVGKMEPFEIILNMLKTKWKQKRHGA